MWPITRSLPAGILSVPSLCWLCWSVCPLGCTSSEEWSRFQNLKRLENATAPFGLLEPQAPSNTKLQVPSHTHPISLLQPPPQDLVLKCALAVAAWLHIVRYVGNGVFDEPMLAQHTLVRISGSGVPAPTQQSPNHHEAVFGLGQGAVPHGLDLGWGDALQRLSAPCPIFLDVLRV